MKKLLLFPAILLIFNHLAAQTEGSGRAGGGRHEGGSFDPNNLPAIGKIWGSVVDSVSGEPVAFATVTLKSRHDSTYLTGGLTDEKGRFNISEIRLGSHQAWVAAVGFEKKEFSVRLSQRSGIELDLGKVLLQPLAVELKTAEVVADKPLMVNAIDRKIFNAEKLMTAAGGSATELMRQVPLVQVDVDGNLSMRGSDNLTVLIDGRPSGLTGAGRKAFLENLPASSVESIEVITNPSSKYDPDGTSGIVNIVLKKNKLSGTSGALSAGIGSQGKYTAGGSFNYKKGRWATSAAYNFRYDDNDSRGASLRENLYPSGKVRSTLDQRNRGFNQPLNHFVKLGIDHYFRPKTVLGTSVSFNKNLREEGETVTTITSDDMGVIKTYGTRVNKQDGDGGTIDANLNFKHEFPQRGHSLVFEANGSRSDNLTTRNFTNQAFNQSGTIPIADPFLQKTINDNKFRLGSVQADYVRPIPKGKVETGAKASTRHVDTDFAALDHDDAAGGFVNDPKRSNHFLFDEKIYAAYASLNQKWGRLGAQAGLRVEQALTTSRLVDTEEEFPNDYASLFPSLFLTWDLAPQRVLGFNYSKRINRPGTEQLNPFADLSDTLNIFKGNPFLKPEYVHSFEVSSQFFLWRFNLVPMVFYRRTFDNISRFTFPPTDPASNALNSTQVNIGSQDSWGYDLVANGSLAKWWSVTASSNGSYSQFNASNLGTAITNSASFRMWNRATSNFSLPKNFDLQVTASLSPPSKVLLGKMYGQNSVDVAVSKKFWNEKATISLRCSDIFDTRRHKMAIETPTFTRDFYRKRESRIAFLNFSYKFGKLVEQKGRGQRGRSQEGSGGQGGDDFGG